MTFNKALIALALAFVLAALSNQPPAKAQAFDAANAAMFAAAANVDSSTPAKPKPKPAEPKTIVVPAGTKVVYEQPKAPKFVYTTVTTPAGKKQRFVDRELGVVCYDNLYEGDAYRVASNCVYIPALKSWP